MNGYTYADMLARSGKNLSITLDGQRLTLRGEPGTPATLQINGVDAPLSQVVHAGDQVTFVPAVPGKDAERTLGQLLKERKLEGAQVLVNREEVPLELDLRPGDAVVVLKNRNQENAESRSEVSPAAAVPEPEMAPNRIHPSPAVPKPETVAEPAAIHPIPAVPEPETVAEPAAIHPSPAVPKPETVAEPAAIHPIPAVPEPETVAEPAAIHPSPAVPKPDRARSDSP